MQNVVLIFPQTLYLPKFENVTISTLFNKNLSTNNLA